LPPHQQQQPPPPPQQFDDGDDDDSLADGEEVNEAEEGIGAGFPGFREVSPREGGTGDSPFAVADHESVLHGKDLMENSGEEDGMAADSSSPTLKAKERLQTWPIILG
jgi:hypothetical protein